MANGRLLGNDLFVGKLYHFTINHTFGFRLNKKANDLANKAKICNCNSSYQKTNKTVMALFINKKKISNIPYQ
jgi:hypothetical protein